jgi:CO/xanthine dehydrogenase Mo-binding subunit
MAVNRVRFVGECVALVVAETREAAHDALELIDVVYETLPAVVDEESAIGDGVPQLHENVPKNITTHFKLYFAILRSPHAHALITGVDLSAASADARRSATS